MGVLWGSMAFSTTDSCNAAAMGAVGVLYGSVGDYRGIMGVYVGTIGVYGVQHHGQWQWGSIGVPMGSIGVFGAIYGFHGVPMGVPIGALSL